MPTSNGRWSHTKANVCFKISINHEIPLCKEAYKVKGGLLFPNGVESDQDKSIVFVAETYRMEVKKYAVSQDITTGKLQVSVVDQIKVPGTAVDNVHYDKDTGDLVIAGHPNGLALVKKAKHATKQENVPIPPSRVVVWHNQSRRIERCLKMMVPPMAHPVQVQQMTRITSYSFLDSMKQAS